MGRKNIFSDMITGGGLVPGVTEYDLSNRMYFWFATSLLHLRWLVGVVCEHQRFSDYFVKHRDFWHLDLTF